MFEEHLQIFTQLSFVVHNSIRQNASFSIVILRFAIVPIIKKYRLSLVHFA